MSRPAPLWPEWLRRELAPHPGRWRHALVIAAASTTALGVVLTLQIASFPAPLIAFKALLPSIVCNWRLLIPRLFVIVSASLVVVPTIGVLVQVPWLMLPVFCMAISVLAYLAPVDQSPIRGYCAALTIAALSYSVVFEPSELGTSALILTGGFVVGLIVATAVSELQHGDLPHSRLSDALAESFADARVRLRESGGRYRAATETAGGAAPADGTPEPVPPPAPAMSQLLLLFDLVRQEHNAPQVERAFIALITAAERIDTYAGVVESLTRRSTGHTYRRLIDAELAALLDAIDHALGRFADVARRPHSVLSTDAAPQERAGPWPDFGALVAGLRARQHALLLAGQISALGLEESANLNAFTQALAGIADVLNSPPEMLEHHAPEVPTVRRAFDPYAAQFAVKIGLATTAALLIGIAAHAESLTTVVLTPLLLAQGSYGATLHKAGLRIVGVVIGGLLSVATVVAVMPNTADVAIWLLVVFAVMLPSAYVVLGTPLLSYVGLQVAITYLIVMVDPRPVVDVHGALWRFFGTLVGTALVLVTFQIVRPDYAGRQIVSRFGDLLRTLLSTLPELDRPLPLVTFAQRRADQMITALAAILRLAEEVRYERHEGGIDREAAVDATGLLRRVAHRWALIRRARREPRPPLPADVHDALGGLESSLRAHLQAQLSLVEARHHRARPGSSQHRAARAAAAVVGARALPDLDAPLRALESAVAAARGSVLLDWPTDAAANLLAEFDHFRRLVELTPALGSSLRRMCLPPMPNEAPELAAAAHPLLGAPSAS